MTPRVEAWINQASDELAMAELALGSGFHAQACYHASQVAETALKGLLIALDVNRRAVMPWSDSSRLLTSAGSTAGRSVTFTSRPSVACPPQRSTQMVTRPRVIALTAATATRHWRWPGEFSLSCSSSFRPDPHLPHQPCPQQQEIPPDLR